MSCEPRRCDWPEDRVGELKRLVADGSFSLAGMGRALGVSRGAVAMKIKRLKLVWTRSANDAAPRNKSEPSRNDAVPAVALEPIVRVDGSLVTIENVGDCECRFPCGDQHGGELRLCGRKTKSGAPYCDDHCRKAFNRQKKNSHIVAGKNVTDVQLVAIAEQVREPI